MNAGIETSIQGKPRAALPVLGMVLALALCLACLPGCGGRATEGTPYDTKGTADREQSADSAVQSEDSSGIPLTWYGKGASSSGASGATEGSDDDLHLELGADGSASLRLGDEVHDATWRYYPEFDSVSTTGQRVTGIMIDLGSAHFVGMVNATTCALLMQEDTDNMLVFGCNKSDKLKDLDFDFGKSESSSSSGKSSSSRGSSSSSSSSGSSGYSGGYSSSYATTGQQNALKKAESYLDHVGGFSKQSLTEQLEYEGFTSSEVDYAIEHCSADWYEQAAEKARRYMDMDYGFSRSSLLEQLEFEGFTSSEAEYGVSSVGL